MVSRFIMRRVACSRRHFIRTVGDDCPYSKKTSVYQLTYPKSVKGRDAAKFHTNFKALRARRVKQTVRWTVCSQSGEQFIIATRNCSRRRSIRTAEDESPYSEKTSVYFLSYQKSVAGLGTQSQVSQRLFCFFFLRLKKEDIPHSQRTAVPTLKSR